MTFEEFIYEKVDVKDVEFVEKYLESMDIEDWLKMGDAYCIKEKEELIKRIEKGIISDDRNSHVDPVFKGIINGL